MPAWVGTLGLFLWVLLAFPGVVVVAAYVGPLDRTPYLMCAAAGAVLAVLIWWVSGRWELGWRNGRASMAVLLGPAMLPLLFIEAGLGANAWFDRSPETYVQSRVIRYELRWIGSGVCFVHSWRGKTQEVLDDAVFVERRAPANYNPGSFVSITTRAGALGWEWVQRVE